MRLKIVDKTFRAHRVLLSHYSPVFEAMISERWLKTKTFQISEEHVDVEVVNDLLSFLYTGRIKLTPHNVHPVCVAAHFLQISKLLEPSVKYLCQLITTENVLTLFEFSITCEIEELNYSCVKFVKNNYELLLKNPQILELPVESFKILIVIMKKFWAKMLRENTFNCIILWTKKNLSERLDELPALLKNIPLEELPLKFLSETVSNHPLVKDFISGIEAVSAAQANYETYSSPELQNNQNLIVVGGCNKRAVYKRSMSCYDSRTGTWSDLPELPSLRSYFGVTVVNHQGIIVCGGYTDKEWLTKTNSMYMFDWGKQTWTKLPDMPFACVHVAIAICKGDLYVVSCDEHDGKKVLRYSFENKQWVHVKSLNENRSGCQLIEYKNHLYVLGGETNTVERYDLERDEWTMMASMRNINELTATAHKNKIYVYGSGGYDQNFEEYDPETNVWTSLPEPLVESKTTSLVSMNGKLLVVGGYLIYDDDEYEDSFDELSDGFEISDLVYEFDFTNRKWIEFCKTTSELIKHNTVVGAFC